MAAALCLVASSTTSVAILGSTKGGPGAALLARIDVAPVITTDGEKVAARRFHVGPHPGLALAAGASAAALDRALSKAPASVVVLAAPIVSSVAPFADPGPWLSVLAAHHVPLVVAGGAAGYERLKIGGTTHLVAGGGLVGERFAGPKHPTSVVSAPAYAWIRLEASPLTASAETIEGVLLDRVVAEVEPPPPPAAARARSPALLLTGALIVLVAFAFVLARAVAP